MPLGTDHVLGASTITPSSRGDYLKYIVIGDVFSVNSSSLELCPLHLTHSNEFWGTYFPEIILKIKVSKEVVITS